MDFEALLNLLDKAIEKSGKKLNTKLLELLENNGDINTAFASFSADFWADFLKAYNKANGGQLSLDELMNLRADKITLSKALYTGLKESKNSVKSVIKTAIKEQKSANELAKMLYEGYDFKNDPLKVKRKFPKYLWQKSAKTKVKNIKTPALRTAYSKILKDESKLVANKALKIAGYEKARYYAKRIALNETARAYNDARAFEYANSDDIQVVKIQMSITHPRTDICDYYAGVDKYGLGAGVYPKDKAPVPPFHPFCRCQMIPKYADEYSKPKLNADADKEYLSGLKEWQRARILGSKAKASEAMKTGDINSVFNAMKPERYKVKSISEAVRQKDTKQTIELQTKNADIEPKINNNIGVKPSINSYQNEDMRDLVRIIEEKKVEYIAPKRLTAKLSNDEIIDKISGGDKTGGSCYSVALAYIANKAGIDVRDFRGGESMKAMREGHIRYFTRFVGVQNVYIDRFQVMDTLIKKLEFGEEYLLAFGRHAAIVRKTDKYIEYLELQAPNRKDNGFKILSVLNLPQRFLKKDDNKNDIYSASIFNIKKLYNNDDFFKLTGYFNTKNGFEMKGEDGEIK